MADTSLTEKKIGLLIWRVSNFWQSKLRNILNKFKISLNEYLILETLFILDDNINFPSQTKISTFSGIDISVVSVCLKSLEHKKLIKRNIDKDNRKKAIINIHQPEDQISLKNAEYRLNLMNISFYICLWH